MPLSSCLWLKYSFELQHFTPEGFEQRFRDWTFCSRQYECMVDLTSPWDSMTRLYSHFHLGTIVGERKGPLSSWDLRFTHSLYFRCQVITEECHSFRSWDIWTCQVTPVWMFPFMLNWLFDHSWILNVGIGIYSTGMFSFNSYLVLFISSLVSRFTSVFRVTLDFRLPQSSMKDVLSNLGINFPLHNGNVTRSRASKAAPNHDAPSTVLQCSELMFSCWCCFTNFFFVSSTMGFCFIHHDTQGLLRSLLLGMIHQQMLPVKSIKMFL